MVVLARQTNGDETVSLADVARRTEISRRYLEQLVIGLKSNGLVRGVSGRKGGYLLSQQPGEISIRAIVEAAIGPINIVDCVLNPDECLKADVCECRWVYELLNDGIRDVLDSMTLEQLAARNKARSLDGIFDLGRDHCKADKS